MSGRKIFKFPHCATHILQLFSFLAHHCLLPPDPINGHRNCTEANNAVYCSLSCMDGYAFAIHPSQVCERIHNSNEITSHAYKFINSELGM